MSVTHVLVWLLAAGAIAAVLRGCYRLLIGGRGLFGRAVVAIAGLGYGLPLAAEGSRPGIVLVVVGGIAAATAAFTTVTWAQYEWRLRRRRRRRPNGAEGHQRSEATVTRPSGPVASSIRPTVLTELEQAMAYRGLLTIYLSDLREAFQAGDMAMVGELASEIEGVAVSLGEAADIVAAERSAVEVKR